jgi:hypothetical protein
MRYIALVTLAAALMLPAQGAGALCPGPRVFRSSIDVTSSPALRCLNLIWAAFRE